jgi:hypothetical protein
MFVLLGIIVLLGVGFFVYFSGDLIKTDSVIHVSPDKPEIELFDSVEYKFTFEYPKTFRASFEDLGDGVKKAVIQGSDLKSGFQITTIPFDETAPLTEGRIKQDLPDLVMKDIGSLDVSGSIALSFNSIDENLGGTFEVWFVSGGNLIQIQTYDEFKSSLLEILKTWKNK